MIQPVRLCSRADLPPEGEAREFTAAGTAVCLATHNGRTTAMNNICPHRGAPLSEGTIEDGKLVCAWHGWAFDLSDGSADGMPGEGAPLYPLQITLDDVFIQIEPAINPATRPSRFPGTKPPRHRIPTLMRTLAKAGVSAANRSPMQSQTRHSPCCPPSGSPLHSLASLPPTPH